ncbi:hypothetical protein BJ875DRAFT_22352 [Amylocarpus encephaloides]|uniref:HD domain-containing protein n=1 Tax=Amylocarpus encephaloides TaxID=45428 RepID=A0A9P7YII3_9HELO|nr:hypothetical protein BJ875DRAFT_22352 [Amylocarpus encephaloides]
MATKSYPQYGWSAVPRDIPTLLKTQSKAQGASPAFSMEELQVPKSALARKVHEYTRKELNRETFNHSLRVWCYGQAILRHSFPSWQSPEFNETYFLTCLLHDIGTTDKNMPATLMSFEFYGGMLAHSLLTNLSSPIQQNESIAESIIRHQDLGSTGTLSRMGALIQLATIFDNMGQNPSLVSRSTVESVVAEYPRLGWSGCFAATIRKENGLKPWAHTTHLGERDFPEGVEGNELMAEWDGTGL